MTLAELLIDQALQGRTVEIGNQPGFAPGLVHVSVTDADGRTFGRGACVSQPAEMRQLVKLAVGDLTGEGAIEALLSAQQSLGQANDGLVIVEYQYDTTSNIAQSLTVINNGTFGTLTYTVTNHADGTLFVFAGFTNPGTLNAKAGSHTFDISAANIGVTFPASPKGGTEIQLGVDVQLGWSSSLV